MKNLGGFQFKIICGYPGSADYVLAMQRGEIDLVSSAWNQWRANHQTEIREGVFVPVIQTGLRRNSELQNVPLMQEMVDDPTLEEGHRVLLGRLRRSAARCIAPPGSAGRPPRGAARRRSTRW